MSLDDADRQLLRELRDELHRLRRGELVARLTEAEREEIAYRVFERLEARLAPRNRDDAEAGPHRAAKRGFFTK